MNELYVRSDCEKEIFDRIHSKTYGDDYIFFNDCPISIETIKKVMNDNKQK